MAIIKCPECGHQISDKAPTCPSCGVEIAGNVTRCPKCGEVYLNNEEWCPHCHYHADSRTEVQRLIQPPVAPVAQPVGQKAQPVNTAPAVGKKSQTASPPPKKKGSKVGVIVSFVIALIICGVCFYMYKDAQDKKERAEWNYAMQSNDPLVLQGYLDAFKDAPQAHRDSIQAHLTAIKQVDEDWTNVRVSNSKAALEEYLRKYPDSNHKQEAKLLIDSIDWAFCQSVNTIEGYQEYMDHHNDGEHYDEAEEAMKKLKTQEITAEEKNLLSSIFHNFFVSINARDEATLLSTVAEGMTLLDKTNVSKSDIEEFMKRWYKDDVTTVMFKLPGGYDIKKREVADGQYEYNVMFPANVDIVHSDAAKNVTKNYRVNATVNPEGKISSLKMTQRME